MLYTQRPLGGSVRQWFLHHVGFISVATDADSHLGLMTSQSHQSMRWLQRCALQRDMCELSQYTKCLCLREKNREAHKSGMICIQEITEYNQQAGWWSPVAVLVSS